MVVTEKGVSTAPLSKDELMAFVRSVTSNEQREKKEPFYVLDLGVTQALYDTWYDTWSRNNLPMVRPFYAVKCNPNLVFLEQLAALGTGFDCASQAEIEAILSLGVSPDRIVFANTCKPEAHIKYAAKVGVSLSTFDSKCELEKMKRWQPKCSLLIRIKVPEPSDATFKYGSKFGARSEEITPLLQTAKDADLQVVGVAFHIGSEAISFREFEEAMAVAKETFETAARLGMPKMRILNIGGGFKSGPKFTEAASAVKAAVDKHFPDADKDGLKFMAEPGRYFSYEPFTLATNVIGKRERDGIKEYWINDGISGSMNFLIYNHDDVVCSTLCFNTLVFDDKYEYDSTVYGPTCNPADTVLEGFRLPDMEVNDWLVFHNMGAYTSSRGSDFNGFKTSAIPTYVANSHEN